MIKFDKLNIEQLQKGHISQHHIWLKYKNDVERQEFRGDVTAMLLCNHRMVRGRRFNNTLGDK